MACITQSMPSDEGSFRYQSDIIPLSMNDMNHFIYETST